jgi:hypothetical protein
VIARARYLEGNFVRTWDTLAPRLSDAHSVTDVAKAFEEGANPYVGPVVSPRLYPLVITIIQDPKYPRRPRARQARFLAESLSGWGDISPRTARDICLRARKRHVPHRILRYEFHIECSCGFNGVSRDHACPTCGAKITFETMDF